MVEKSDGKITIPPTTTHRTFPEYQQRTPGFQKGKQISSEWGRVKDEDKEGDKEFWGRDLCPGEWVMKEEKFPHTGKPPNRWSQGVVWEPQKAVKQWIFRRQNEENSPQRSCWMALLALPSQKVANTLTTATKSRGWVRRLRLQIQTSRRGSGW